MNSSNVTYGKPKKSGAIYTAPVGTPLPASVRAEKNEAFKNAGYISEDGVTNSNSGDSTDIKAWGGDVVMSAQEGKEDKFKFVMIETLGKTPMEVVYGSANVSGDLTDGITIKANNDTPEERSWIIDIGMRNGILKRIVIPKATLTELGDIVYKDNEAVGYDVTLSAYPDSNGNTHYEYIQYGSVLASPTVEPEDGTKTLYGTLVSDMQEGVVVSGNGITGTLKFIEGGISPSGPLSGDGYFLALKLSDFDNRATSVKVGLDESQGTGLVEILNDPDKNLVAKITDKDAQVFKVVSTNGTLTTTDTYSLSGLTLEE